MHSRCFQVWVEPRRPRHVKVRQFKRLHDLRVTFSEVCLLSLIWYVNLSRIVLQQCVLHHNLLVVAGVKEVIKYAPNPT